MSMHARVVQVLALLCVFAVVPPAEAARRGTYRCILEVPQGGIGWILQYNPNSIPQTVTRIRAWDSTGGFLDTGTIAQEIPANGSDVVFFWDGTADGFVGDGFQVVVDWTQSQDKPAPLPRADMLPDGTLASTVRQSCP